jgi:hypothetical protein
MNGIAGEQPDAVRAGIVDLAQHVTDGPAGLLTDNHHSQHKHRNPYQQLDSIPSAHSILASIPDVKLLNQCVILLTWEYISSAALITFEFDS